MVRSGLDTLDLQILRELTQARTVLPARPGPNPSYRKVARALRLTPGTVRNRVRRMVGSGILGGSSIYPNPNLLGLATFAYAFDAGRTVAKDDLVRRLRRREGVFFVQNFRGPLVGVAFLLPKSAAVGPVLRAIDRLAHARPGWWTPVPYPPCGSELKPSDRALLVRLARGPFASYQELATDLHRSVRTVKRKMASLVDAMAILSVPNLNYGAISDRLPADLVVTYTGPASRPEAEARLLQLVGPYLIYAGIWPQFGLYSMVLPKVVLAREIAQRAQQVPGVRKARVEFVDDHYDETRAFEPYLRA